MMKFCVLASGSKGNATYLETPSAKILIDVGVSLDYLKKELQKISVNISDLTHVFVTHNHSDHIKGLKALLKKHPITLALSEQMLNSLKIPEENKLLMYESNLEILDLTVKVFRTSHDIDDSFAFIFEHNDISLVYITDTGYLNLKYFKHLKNKDVYIIESNHDVELLMNSKYPHYLKTRIIGDKGHLSNEDCAYYLCKLVGAKTQHIVLAHLSEENNTPELALKATKKRLSDKHFKKVSVALQHESTGIYEVRND